MVEAAPGVVRRRVVARGQVQGVGFRVSCARRAVAAGLAGWVANRADGNVEAVFEGPSDEVDALVSWCAHGPPMARVNSVDVTDEPPRGERSFSVR